jgi:hypothetical protein
MNMKQTAIRFTTLLCAVMLVLLSSFAEAFAKRPSANELLLSSDPTHRELRMTTTVVEQDRFTPGTPAFTTGITDVKFAVQKIRTDVQLWDTIPPALRMQRNGVMWNEQNMLISGIGFTGNTTYRYGKEQGQGRYLNLRVMYPRSGWNGKLYFWQHGFTDIQAATYTPIIEPEQLLKEGWAVAMAQFNGAVPEQQNPNADDDSYWKAVDEMYRADPANYWSYQAHPDWWSHNGAALGDGATLRNMANLVKNLLYRELGRHPERAYWFGWSAGGPAGTAANTGRSAAGYYVGGNFNLPYDETSGRIYDAFLTIEPVFSAAAPVDPQYPVSAPYVFVGGSAANLTLAWPSGINFAHKVKLALDAEDASGNPLADPSLSRNINDWFRLYVQEYGNHDWTGHYYEVQYSGADQPLYYDITQPLLEGLNTDGRGRKLNWVMTKLAQHSPVYLQDWLDQNKPGWGQITSGYYYLNDGYHLQIFRNTVDWVEQGVQPPASRIDPLLLSPDVDLNTLRYPDLPTRDFSQDSLNRNNSLLNAAMRADLTWQRNNPGQAIDFAVDKGMPAMPHLAARWGIFYIGHQYQQIFPFTPQQLMDGYHHGNISFAGYASYDAYLGTFRQALAELVAERLYDPSIADLFMNGDPAAPRLPLP